jgi:hypothetical protein
MLLGKYASTGWCYPQKKQTEIGLGYLPGTGEYICPGDRVSTTG